MRSRAICAGPHLRFWGGPGVEKPRKNANFHARDGIALIQQCNHAKIYGCIGMFGPKEPSFAKLLARTPTNYGLSVAPQPQIQPSQRRVENWQGIRGSLVEVFGLEAGATCWQSWPKFLYSR